MIKFGQVWSRLFKKQQSRPKLNPFTRIEDSSIVSVSLNHL